MALTDLQKPTLEDFYNSVKDGAGALYRLAKQIKSQHEFLVRMGVPELDDLGVQAGDLRTDLNEYRIFLGEFVDLFDGVAVDPTNPPF